MDEEYIGRKLHEIEVSLRTIKGLQTAIMEGLNRNAIMENETANPKGNGFGNAKDKAGRPVKKNA